MFDRVIESKIYDGLLMMRMTFVNLLLKNHLHSITFLIFFEWKHRQLFRHKGRAHRIALVPLCPTQFYSCGEDGETIVIIIVSLDALPLEGILLLHSSLLLLEQQLNMTAKDSFYTVYWYFLD